MGAVNLSNYITPKLLRTKENSCNCSLFNIGNRVFLISRCVSYFLGETYGFVKYGKFHTDNFLYEVDSNFNLNKIKELCNPYKGQQDVKYNGLEDIRTINWDGKIHFICSKVIGNSDAATIYHGQFSADTLDLCAGVEFKTSNPREKNWSPIESFPYTCVYALNPIVTVNLQNRAFCTKNGGLQGARGSSCLKRLNNNTLIALVHYKDSSFRYLHQLVKYDNHLNIIAVSQKFTFVGAKTEFCCSIQVLEDGIVLLPAINDGISYVFKIPFALVDNLFSRTLTNDWIDPNLYNKLFLDAIAIRVPEVAATAACCATDKYMITAAVKYNHEISNLDFDNRCRRQNILLDKLYSIIG